MMYAATVMKVERAINLFDAKGKLLTHLELGRHPLHFESSKLFISAGLESDLFGKEPFTEAKQKTTIFGNLTPVNLNLAGFSEKSFLGEIPKISIHFSEGNEYYLRARAWEPGYPDSTNALHIDAILPKEMFREVFHPIWVRQAQAKLSLTLNVIGYQSGAEGAFGEPGDTENILIEANADIDAKLTAIRLTTQLQ